MGEERIEEVYALIKEMLGEVQGCRGYADDLELALRAARAGEADDIPFILLPMLCCQAVGGDGRQAVGAAAAWHLLFLAARILDDLEDRDMERALWVVIGPARALNAATGLIFTALLALAHPSGGAGGVADGLLLTLHRDFNRTVLRICAGQHGDLAQQEVSLKDYWATVAAKAGEPVALACRAGAVLGGGDRQQIALLSAFGHNLGVLTQIGDDFHGVWGPSRRLCPSGEGDLAAGRKTLPVLYALAVAPAHLREHLRELLVKATDDAGAEAQARQMVTDLGAPYYLLVEADLRRQRGSAALQAMGPLSPALPRLLVLLDRASPWSDPSSYPSPGKGCDYPRTPRGTILTDSTG